VVVFEEREVVMNHSKSSNTHTAKEKWEAEKNLVLDDNDIIVARCCGKYSAQKIVHEHNSFEGMSEVLKEIIFNYEVCGKILNIDKAKQAIKTQRISHD